MCISLKTNVQHVLCHSVCSSFGTVHRMSSLLVLVQAAAYILVLATATPALTYVLLQHPTHNGECVQWHTT
jgi:hypothetical protein